jgi:hypothetical protein
VPSTSHLAELEIESTDVAAAWSDLEPVVARCAETWGDLRPRAITASVTRMTRARWPGPICVSASIA